MQMGSWHLQHYDAKETKGSTLRGLEVIVQIIPARLWKMLAQDVMSMCVPYPNGVLS